MARTRGRRILLGAITAAATLGLIAVAVVASSAVGSAAGPASAASESAGSGTAAPGSLGSGSAALASPGSANSGSGTGEVVPLGSGNAAASAEPAASASAAADSAAPGAGAGAAAASPTVVVAIGDSIMDGHGMQPDEAWPALVSSENGWQLDNLSVDGSGFLQPGDDGTTFAEQISRAATLAPRIVLISGSSNDLGIDDDELSAATTNAFAELRSELPDAQIVAVSTFWGDTDEPDQLAVIDAQVQSASAAVGGSYLDIGEPLTGRPDLMQDDDVHPTPAGQLLLADAVQQRFLTLPAG